MSDKDDCISRKMAIDTIMGQPPEPHYPSWYAAQIEKLPAAQPDHTADIGKKVSIPCAHENDLISRRALCKYAQNQKDKSVTPNDIMRFPSAQPATNCSEIPNSSDDTISRQMAIDAICAICGNDCDKSEFIYDAPQTEQVILCPEHYALSTLPSAQPETATVTIGRTKGGVVMWYECDACGESIDQKDCYCRNCGRKLTLPEPYREVGRNEQTD